MTILKQSIAIVTVGWLLWSLPSPPVRAAATNNPAAAAAAAPAQRALLDQYCVACHNQRLKSGNLALDTPDVAKAGTEPEVWERVIRKLRLNAMPPPGRPRPDAPAARRSCGKPRLYRALVPALVSATIVS